MSDIHSLIPKDKHDLECVDRVSQLGYPAIAPILPQLLEWVQDINWPVAYPLSRLLASIGEPLIPPLLEVLHSEDGIWKYNCIEFVIKPMRMDVKRKLAAELELIAKMPSKTDILEEVHLVAQEAIDEMA
jgi:hypothetical protein